MIKLIGQDINGKTVIVECADQRAVRRAKYIYAKVGTHLESYDRAIQAEAKRLLMGEDRPAPKYRF